MTSPRALAIVAGLGPGISYGLAHKFAIAYDLILLARSESTLDSLISKLSSDPTIKSLKTVPKIVGIPTDVTSIESMSAAIEKVHSLGQPVTLAVYNVSAGFKRTPFLETDLKDIENGFKGGGLGGAVFAKAVLPLLLDSVGKVSWPPGGRVNPTLIYTGATASFKANPGMSAFAIGKWSLRALSQSLAREFGPKGVHVATVNIDAVVDLERSRGILEDVEDAKLKPAEVAETYWGLHQQGRSAWTWEVDVRPWVEKW
ncbi:hypothetical protein V1525DRAFT_426542 [Lipomyces kononenkoae]|uniref:Uncharacterized protein n=1 Tax=Lipomyces kononenkoae TaxID=34357 RepID=A0ACC3SZT9_LIPKO